MPIYQIKLLSKQLITPNTWRFKFEKPEGLTFKPGQYGGFTLIDPPMVDNGGVTRRFSLLSAPNAPELEIATRIQSSAFKQTLLNLPIGATVKFAGPTGLFTLHTDLNVPAVFIAGGIGVAPFYSMLKNELDKPTGRSITLFYGNQSVQDAPFLQELINLQKILPNFKIVPAVNQAESDPFYETGFVNASMLKKYINALNEPIYYVCGSPIMVTTLQETLVEMGIPNQQIQVEDFPGY